MKSEFMIIKKHGSKCPIMYIYGNVQNKQTKIPNRLGKKDEERNPKSTARKGDAGAIKLLV